jgi:glycosyltransferase involved in cell wall biosynthesis
MIKILHITPDFNYSCGRSKLVFLYLKHFSNKSNYETHFITNGGDSLDRLEEIPNLKYEIRNFSTGIKNIFFGLGFYTQLKENVLKNKIDLIHTHHRFPEFISTKIGKELSIKTVTSAHSFVTGFKYNSFASDLVISVSNSISNFLIKNYNIKKEKLITLYNPVDQFSQFDIMKINLFRTKYNISTDRKVLLFMGRLNRVKGLDTILKSFEIVREKNSNVVLIINGQFRDKKFKRHSFSANSSILFVPPQKDSYYLFAIADIVLLPSREDPFPFVMIESGRFKKPFIGGNTGGIAEFIEDGKNGLLVDPGNPQQLAEKIIYLLNNPNVGKMLGENLFSKVNTLCDLNNYFSNVEKIYNSLLASK